VISRATQRDRPNCATTENAAFDEMQSKVSLWTQPEKLAVVDWITSARMDGSDAQLRQHDKLGLHAHASRSSRTLRPLIHLCQLLASWRRCWKATLSDKDVATAAMERRRRLPTRHSCSRRFSERTIRALRIRILAIGSSPLSFAFLHFST